MNSFWKYTKEDNSITDMPFCDTLTVSTLRNMRVEYTRYKGEDNKRACDLCKENSPEIVSFINDGNESIGNIACSSVPVLAVCPKCARETMSKLASIADYFIGGKLEKHILEAARTRIGYESDDDWGDNPAPTSPEELSAIDGYIERENRVAAEIQAESEALAGRMLDINAYKVDSPYVYMLTYESDIGEKQIMSVYGTLGRAIYNMHLLKIKLSKSEYFKDANVTITAMQLNRPLDSLQDI